MADNIQAPAGSGSDPAVATDEIDSVHYQKVKLALGAENVVDTLLQAGQQSMANSLPVAIAANQTPIPVNATGTVGVSSISAGVVPGTGATHLGKAEDAPHASGDTGVMLLGVRSDAGGALTDTDGDYAPISLNAAGRVRVEAAGSTAHDGADSGNPVKVGGRARSSDIAAVANDDRTDFVADLTGKQVVRPHCIAEQQVSGVASTSGTGDTSVIAAQGVGVRLYVTSISIANSSANNPVVEIKSGTTVIWRTIAPASGGSNIIFDPPLRLAANEALNMASLTGSSTVYFSANGYRGG
jgi:hypothetical protein